MNNTHTNSNPNIDCTQTQSQSSTDRTSMSMSGDKTNGIQHATSNYGTMKNNQNIHIDNDNNNDENENDDNSNEYTTAPYSDNNNSYSSLLAHKLDKYFHITKRGSSITTEIRSGLVTFVT